MIVVGVSGATCAGKTTIAEALAKIMDSFANVEAKHLNQVYFLPTFLEIFIRYKFEISAVSQCHDIFLPRRLKFVLEFLTDLCVVPTT